MSESLVMIKLLFVVFLRLHSCSTLKTLYSRGRWIKMEALFVGAMVNPGIRAPMVIHYLTLMRDW